jgi:hypothetical protein
MTESSKARRWGGKAVRPVAISVFTLLMIFWIEYGFGKPLADVWRDVRYGVVIAVLVTGLCCIVMPPVAQRVWGFHPLIR